MEQIFNRKYFKLFFIFYVFLNTLSLQYFGIERNPLYPIVFLWGILILGYDLYKKQLFYKNSHLGLIGMYGIILLLATYFNKEYSNQDSYLILGMQLLIFLLLFANPKKTTLKQIKEEIRTIIPFTTVLTLTATFISLLMFFFNISSTRNGMSIGLLGDRLFGIYFNCNPAAFLACMMMVFSMIAIKSKYRFPLLYYVNFVAQLLYIILSGCRTALIVVILIAIAVLYYKLFSKHGYSRIKQIAVSLFVCITIVFGSSIVQKTLYFIPQMQGAETVTTSRFQFDKIIEIMTLIQEGKSSNLHRIYDLTNEVSSGRVELLNTAYKVFRYNPIQGVGVNNFQRMGVVLNPSDHVVQQPQVVHTHNVFVETAVIGGIFGFMVFFLFFLKSSATIWTTFKKYAGSSSYFIILCFTLVVLSDFLGGMFDYGVFYVYSLSSTLSWVFLGYLYWLNDHPMLKLSSDSKYYDFMYYHLVKVDYQRSRTENFENVVIQILDSACDDEVYIVKVDIVLNYKAIQDHFIYHAIFDVIGASKEQLDECKDNMALELYEMVSQEIATLISDGNDVTQLPKGNVNIVT
ncbi:MAG: O-antigen ligase domain-containing protein [Erysipelotrichia bacterium]|nr:O-antigen ligase domain-containing protein [Erysipelotrichia bacterium]NCC53924.1 O-antigen ligase domain-containing protein [Erysipelotrichia bacterium]